MDTLNKILTLMSQNGISNSKMAQHLGVSVSQISNWKSGNNASYLKYISQIATFLNVSTDYLLGKEQKNSPSQLSDEELEYFYRIKNLPLELQRAVRAIVESDTKK